MTKTEVDTFINAFLSKGTTITDFETYYVSVDW